MLVDPFTMLVSLDNNYPGGKVVYRVCRTVPRS